jgi:hypothetical protein
MVTLVFLEHLWLDADQLSVPFHADMLLCSMGKRVSLITNRLRTA